MFRLGINTGFAVNRYAEPEEWTAILKIVGVKYAQFTADLLNVSLPDKIINNQLIRIKNSCQDNEIEIRSAFTGAFTRVNHLAHPDKEIRDYWVSWFKKYVDLAVELGASSIGSHPGIFTMKDDLDSKRREERRLQNIENWHEVAKYAKVKGLKYIAWEPMSISREQGETIAEARRLQDDLNNNAPIPFKMCLDVDHGDLASKNPDDTDPYKWLENFANVSPQIHLKQSLQNNKGGHFPFLPEYNKQGKIKADEYLSALKNNNVKDVDLILELSFKERQPQDSSVIHALSSSVKYWKEAMNKG